MFLIFLLTIAIMWVVIYAKRQSIVKATVETWLMITVLVWCMTELLSAFQCWTKIPVFISWLLIVIITVAIGYQKKAFQTIREMFETKKGIAQIGIEHKKIMAFSGGIWLMITVIALLRSQSLIDNICHRLVKIMHWMQNGAVGPYATNSIRQVQLSDLVEYMNAQILILGGNDRLMSIIQIGAHFCAGIIIYGICRKLNLKFKAALTAAWLYWLIPAGLIEVITTQTDVVAAVYLLTFIYYLLDFISLDKLCLDRNGIWMAVGLALSAVFGYLAKPSVCFAMLVFLIWMGLVRLIKRDKLYVLSVYLLLGSLILVMFAAPSYFRERSTEKVITIETTTGSEDEKDTAVSNADTTIIQAPVEYNRARVLYNIEHPSTFVLNCVQNLAANATSRCFPQVNLWLKRVVDKIDYEIGDGEGQFRVFVDVASRGETNEPSPCIMWFVLIAGVLLICRRCVLSREQLLFWWCSIISLIVQAGLMGYTYYRQRYLIGIMAILCISIMLVVDNLKKPAISKDNMVMAMVIISSLGAINAITYETQYTIDGFTGGKNHQYFLFAGSAEPYYEKMISYVNDAGYTNIGVQGELAYEYIFWQTINNLNRLETVNVQYASLKKYEDMEYIPECILMEGTEQIYLETQIECHNVTYECVWSEVSDSGKCYTVYDKVK